MVYLQTLNYLPIILIISADKNEIMPICKEKEKYEHMQLIADYADKPSYLQICLFIGRYCRYTDKPIYGNAKSADTDIVSAAYLQIVSADNFIGCSLHPEMEIEASKYRNGKSGTAAISIPRSGPPSSS